MYAHTHLGNRQMRLHRLVAAVFLKDHPNQCKQFTNPLFAKYNKIFDVHHKDGNPANNHYENLQYVTPKQNNVCANGVCVVAKTMNHAVIYWSMKDCCETYSIYDTYRLREIYLDIDKTYDFMGQTFNFVTWNRFYSNADPETQVPSNCVDFPDKKFRQFINVLRDLNREPDDLAKTKYLKRFFEKGSDNSFFKGDKYLYIKLFLSHNLNANKRNVNEDFLITTLENISGHTNEEITKHKDKTNSLAKTFVYFMLKSTTTFNLKPINSSSVNLKDIVFALDDLYSTTNTTYFATKLCNIIEHLNADDSELFIRLYLKEELFSNSKKIIFDSIHEEAYEMFENSENPDEIFENFSNSEL
jgi:hypothetical protein